MGGLNGRTMNTTEVWYTLGTLPWSRLNCIFGDLPVEYQTTYPKMPCKILL
jgi:hypothetical protein